MVAASSSGSISVWNRSDLRKTNEIPPTSGSYFASVKMDDRKIIVADWNKTIKIYHFGKHIL